MQTPSLATSSPLRLRRRQFALQRIQLVPQGPRRELLDPPRLERGEDWGRCRNDLSPKLTPNFAWVQHYIRRPAPQGMAGLVLAYGRISSKQYGEGDINRYNSQACRSARQDVAEAVERKVVS